MERINISEILARKRLEPELVDIYVEGESDHAFFRRYLELHKKSDYVSIFKIDQIEIPIDQLDKYKLLGHSSRNMVILLSHIIFRDFREAENILCLIDADFDYLLGTIHDNKFLIRTDFSALELYSYELKLIRTLFTFTFRIEDEDWSKLLDNLSSVLITLFLVHSTNEEMKLYMTELKYDKYFSISDGLFSLDIDGYINAYLMKNGKISRRDEFLEKFNFLKSKLTEEKRNFIHGHDMTYFLFHYIRYRCGRKCTLSSHDGFERHLYALINYNELGKYPLFSRINKIIGDSKIS